MDKKIAILLPYKEIYNSKKAGAASIWVKDYLKGSYYKNDTLVYGNLKKKLKPITSNFKNITLDKFVIKKNLYYTKKFYELCIKENHKIIEIHNRPESLIYFHKMNIDKKFRLIFFFHNNPLELRGSKTINERKNILDKTDYIFFVSKWVKSKFFEGLEENENNNCEILYPSIKKPLIFNSNKKKNIIFTGKLNSSKGYDVFLKSVVKILDNFNDWTATVIGNEPREKFSIYHNKLKIFPWKRHKEILNFYNESSISVVNSRWEEPFGRTAMESAAYGCATIISNRGGLPETFDSELILKKNNESELYNLISKLIKNPNLLKHIQKKNFDNVKHTIEKKIIKLDKIKKFFLIDKVNFFKSKNKKIIHISTFDERNNHRLFNISLANKISKGFIRNNHDVINFSYRNHLNPINKNDTSKINKSILEITKNYNPDIIILGHNNVLSFETIEKIKSYNKAKIALWYEDAVSKKSKGPSWRSNLDLIQKNSELIDSYFLTTHPSQISHTNINKKKINFLPILVDQNIENQKFYKFKNKFKDLFFGLSHGVNHGGLKKNKTDEREIFLKKIFDYNNSENFNLKLNILGIGNEKPKWNYEFYYEVLKCKMALNLSRGNPSKYASSNRIASLVGNGVYTFIDKRTKFNDFFDDNEMGFYSDHEELVNKIYSLKSDEKKLYNYAKNGSKKYFNLFNSKLVTNYIINRLYNNQNDKKQIWETY